MTTADTYRRANVDEFDDSNDKDGINLDADQIQEAIRQQVRDSKSLLHKGSSCQSVVTAIVQYSPCNISDQALEEESLVILTSALSQIKGAEILAFVQSLDGKYLDNLMRYIYRALAKPEKFNSGIYLQWHSAIVQTSGVGSIVRAITERKSR